VEVPVFLAAVFEHNHFEKFGLKKTNQSSAKKTETSAKETKQKTAKTKQKKQQKTKKNFGFDF